jgi:hypothetical protein
VSERAPTTLGYRKAGSHGNTREGRWKLVHEGTTVKALVGQVEKNMRSSRAYRQTSGQLAWAAVRDGAR